LSSKNKGKIGMLKEALQGTGEASMDFCLMSLHIIQTKLSWETAARDIHCIALPLLV